MPAESPMEHMHTPERVVTVTSLEELQGMLKKHGISTDDWGKGKAKTINDLFAENHVGASKFIERGAGIIRLVRPLRINVFHHAADGANYVLREQHQFFHDGRGAGKERTHVASVSEKIEKQERPADAVTRALEEELSGVKGPFDTTFKDKRLEDRDSDSYPGLPSEYLVHEFDARLSDEQFNPQGYCEVREGKTVCFKWEKMENGGLSI